MRGFCRAFFDFLKGITMDEKILIKSEVNETLKKILKWGPLVLFGIAALISICLCFKYEYEEYSYWFGKTFTYTSIGWNLVFDFGEQTHFFVLFVIGCLCLLSAIIIGIIYLVNRNCELQVTDKNVKGKTLLGKEVVLPLYMVSAYSTRKFLSVITIATASGITKFSLIQNYKEIGDILSKTINEIQASTATSQVGTASPTQSNSIDDLIKLKDLLDAGIITQEEFDAKKKQLLGL